MTKLPQIKPERLTAARDAILPLFEKACRVIAAHSQPLETLSVPDLRPAEAGLAAAQRARDAYLKS